MELKTDGSHYEFIIRETVMNEILNWSDFSDVAEIRGYFKKNEFPEDKLYSQNEFLEEVEGSDRFIHLIVEKPQTTEFIMGLCYEVI